MREENAFSIDAVALRHVSCSSNVAGTSFDAFKNFLYHEDMAFSWSSQEGGMLALQAYTMRCNVANW